MSDLDFDDDDLNSNDGYNDFIEPNAAEHQRGSDEDTEDASETDMVKYEGEYMEIKEQMYQDKLASLKELMKQLDNRTHPDYVRLTERQKQMYQERLFLNDVILEFETERIEREYLEEKRAAVREFEERKTDLRESLIAELEEKKKLIEMERSSAEIMHEGCELKPVPTRKLRRRANEPVNSNMTGTSEKRGKRGGPPTQLNQLLDDAEINEDLKVLTKAMAKYNRTN